jgi:hypothetical protein
MVKKILLKNAKVFIVIDLIILKLIIKQMQLILLLFVKFMEILNKCH